MSRNKLTVIIVFLISLAFLSAASAAAAPQESQAVKKALADFAAFYELKLKEAGTSGSSFMLDHKNKILARHHYGLANIEKQQKVDDATIYHWASITKTLTAIAIMQLRDRGLLSSMIRPSSSCRSSVRSMIPSAIKVRSPSGS